MIELVRTPTSAGSDPNVTELAGTITDASTSMRLDHLVRRLSEIDVINGAVVDLGRELSIDIPDNEALCAILPQRESRYE